MNSEKPPSRKVAAAFYKLAGHTWPQAAKLAGYSASYSAKAARLADDPEVAAIIEQGQAELRRTVMMDAAQAYAKLEELIAFARSKGNAMACMKGAEIQCRLAGLLVDKLEVKTTVDIGAALQEAKQRSARIVNASALAPPTFDTSHHAKDHGVDDPFAD